MIFVTIGTSEPFDRLLRGVDALPRGEEIVVQRGASRVTPRHARCFDFLTYEQVIAHIRAARAVVTHAGAGSVMTCFAYGKRPIVIPRLRRFGETSDDHQLAFARRLARAGFVTLVEEPERLAEALQAADAAIVAVDSSAGLVGELRDYLARALGGAAT